MQIDAVHVLVVVAMSSMPATPTIVLFMRVPMTMPVVMPMRMVMAVMVVVAKGCHAHQVDQQSESAHNQQLGESFRLGTFPESLERLESNFHAEKPTRS